jgi:hypothetical protein
MKCNQKGKEDFGRPNMTHEVGVEFQPNFALMNTA